ncbi:HPF/RaiA family ribosome-associated protein [Sessilibacter corallicola]|uniref:HPF/RaiA family ribosome-associated protein n=1 Tax=Sessilibacter corallicola TaxID=2904075 RepID=UPI001E544933|nr:HPF/RaiA family ribosome-associated protein [Sessilibacter corallicola]MCE2030066.1 HPF/RaiA family ribosome-associated protein [Sessilibacter corallicola]
MLIKIHTPTFPQTNALSNYVDAKIRLALGLYRDKIRVVDVFLTDENGPKGGNDMRCKIVVKADRYPLTITQETADDIYDSINNCSHRIKRAVGRRFDRALQRRKSHAGFELMEQNSEQESEPFESQPINTGAA